MKALAKAPEERYQSGQELVNDLERCKESAPKKDAKKTAAAPAKGLNVPQAAKPAASAAASAKEIRCRCAEQRVAAGKFRPARQRPRLRRQDGKAPGSLAVESPSHRKRFRRHRRPWRKAHSRSEPARWPRPKKLQSDSATSGPAHGVDPAMAERPKEKQGARPQLFRNQRTASTERNLYTAATASGERRLKLEPVPAAVEQQGSAGKAQGAAARSGPQGGNGNQEDSAQAVRVFDCCGLRRDPADCRHRLHGASIRKIPRTKVRRSSRPRPRHPTRPRSRRGTPLQPPTPTPAPSAVPEHIAAGRGTGRGFRYAQVQPEEDQGGAGFRDRQRSPAS